MSYFEGKLNISISSASGIEAITKRELTALGYAAGGAINGRINFSGTLFDVARCNVFLRTAGRVRIVLSEFKAETFDELFDGVKSIPWEDIVLHDSKILISAKSFKSKLFALSAIQSVAKKAIVDRMTEKFKRSPSETGNVFSLEISITDDIASVALDTTGDALHKRGYRTLLGDAPLRETTAAAMLLLSVFKSDRQLIDPFAGSGTIPIEAALIATDTAPGLNRSFVFESFPNGDKALATAKEEAMSKIKEIPLRISGFDINPKAISLAQYHAERANVKNKIHFQTMDMRGVSSRFSHGVIVTNPPYGVRLMKNDELFELYKDFGKMFGTLKDWSAYVLTSCRAFEKYFGKRATKKRTMYNSELECTLFSFLGNPPKNIVKNIENSEEKILDDSQ